MRCVPALRDNTVTVSLPARPLNKRRPLCGRQGLPAAAAWTALTAGSFRIGKLPACHHRSALPFNPWDPPFQRLAPKRSAAIRRQGEPRKTRMTEVAAGSPRPLPVACHGRPLLPHCLLPSGIWSQRGAAAVFWRR